MREARQQYLISSLSLEEINFILNLLANRLDELEGRRGTPGFYTAPDMNSNKVTNVADGSAATDGVSYSQLSSSAVDHGSVGGLTDDDHAQYALLAGRSGDTLKMNTIAEVTAAAGVTIDSCTLKDGGAEAVTDQGGGSNLKATVLSFSGWNMDSTASINVAHGVTGANILAVLAYVQQSGSSYHAMLSGDRGGYIESDGTNVVLARNPASAFDAAGYNNVSGKVLVIYTE